MTDNHTEIAPRNQTSEGSERRPTGLIPSIVVNLALLALLVWQFVGVADDGQQFQVLDPDLPLIWRVALPVTIGISTACRMAVWARRRWTIPLAIVNVAMNWVGAAMIIALAVEGLLFDPTLPDQIGATFETSADWNELSEPFVLVVAGLAIWDSIDGFRRARSSTIDDED